MREKAFQVCQKWMYEMFLSCYVIHVFLPQTRPFFAVCNLNIENDLSIKTPTQTIPPPPAPLNWPSEVYCCVHKTHDLLQALKSENIILIFCTRLWLKKLFVIFHFATSDTFSENGDSIEWTNKETLKQILWNN